MAKKTVNTDIYNLSQLVDDVKSVFIPDETEETLAIGTYGYIGALESHRLQTQVQMTGELSNESFPSRARLERNVITHAIMANIEDINAIPAKMTAFLAIKENDILDNIDNSIFVIDRECPFYIGDFEFHLEYDIILHKIYIPGKSTNAYTAQYDMSRENPSSSITTPYLSAPAVMIVDNESYVYLTVIISQVEHHTEYKKLVTSNIVDNKTINFIFENQLAYFEVHCKDSDDDHYLTPIFEGGGVPEGLNYYCWYQYIDTDLIRVRFDRNSYMPGLNTEVECQIKTSRGSAGNFTYSEEVYVNLESSEYGYKGITALLSPVSESSGGKDRKTKKELQSLIPKEVLARGSLTTITDLNNYFGMLDSDYGRIVIQKKADNQIERVYYAYFVAKDSNMNVIPSNTIDLRVGLEDLEKIMLTDSQSARYVLKSGKCIMLGKDGVGYINHDPIIDHGEYLVAADKISRGKYVTMTFTTEVQDADYDYLAAYVTVGDAATTELTIPISASGNEIINPHPSDEIHEVEDYMQMSVGDHYLYTADFLSKSDTKEMVITDSGLECFDFYEAYYYTDPNEIIYVDALPISVKVPKDTKLHVGITRTINVKANKITSNIISNTISLTQGTNSDSKIYTCYVPTLSQSGAKETVEVGDRIIYTLKYRSTSATAYPTITIKLARGLEYVLFTNKISYEDGESYNYEPSKVLLTEDLGFVYTNPYAISINGYHLYSAFYMMSMSENPYLHFDYINQKSNVQFISTNVSWDRPFLGYLKDTYTMSITITQSVQDSLGLIPDDGSEPFVKCLAVFYRDKKPYRYRTLKIVSWDAVTESFTFAQEFYAKDIFDNDNNIRIEGMQVCGQTEYSVKFTCGNAMYELQAAQSIDFMDLAEALGIAEEGTPAEISIPEYGVKVIPNKDKEPDAWKIIAFSEFDDDIVIKVTYKDAQAQVTKIIEINARCLQGAISEYGFFNPTTELKIYAICGIPDVEGVYSSDDLSSICPGLTEWTLTNKYDIVNGVTTYHNYSEIMGSRATPYGETVEGTEPDNKVMELEGFNIMNVPMLGYDYCQVEDLVQDAINTLNHRKLYIETASELLENSFGVDFKLFNTYGPAHTYYIIRDKDNNGILDDRKEYIDKVNLTLNFRVRLASDKDSYTKSNIINEIKDYINDLDDLTDLHIPNLVTQITTNYKENITYFEYLGFNSYGADIQHIYKDADSDIDIHTAPEFLNINGIVDASTGTITDDINIYLSEI